MRLSIEAARRQLEARSAKVRELAKAAADKAMGDPRGDQARKILAEVGARVNLEETSDVPLQFRTDPERAIADELERSTGAKFTAGRKVGSVSPIRRRMAALLAKHPTMTNDELWKAIQAQPPRGHHLYDEPDRYVSTPSGSSDMSYATFRNAASNLRRQLKG